MSQPQLSYPAAAPSATYMVICLDLDAPFPSFNPLSPILHWLQPGLKLSGTEGALECGEPWVVNYAPPGPPPISSPHRYVYFLYEQPAGFDGSQHAPPDGQLVGIGPRVRWSLDEWEEKIKLGPVLAVNFHNSN